MQSTPHTAHSAMINGFGGPEEGAPTLVYYLSTSRAGTHNLLPGRTYFKRLVLSFTAAINSCKVLLLTLKQDTTIANSYAVSSMELSNDRCTTTSQHTYQADNFDMNFILTIQTDLLCKQYL